MHWKPSVLVVLAFACPLSSGNSSIEQTARSILVDGLHEHDPKTRKQAALAIGFIGRGEGAVVLRLML